MADEADSVPRPSLAEKVTVSPESGFPLNVTVAVMVEVVEPAAMEVGDAEIPPISGSLTRTASKGMVCP